MSGNRPNGQPRWVPPPGWPEPPFGWSPPTGWTSDASWGPVPPGWSVWQDADGRPAAPPWSPGSRTPPRRVHPPLLKAGELRNTSPRNKKSTAGVIAFILLAFLAGGCANDKPTEPDTTSAAAEGRASSLPTLSPTAAPAAEPAPTSSPEPPPAPEPPTTDQIIARAQPSTALALLATLEVKGRAPKTGYDRDLFGQAWADTDRNGCATTCSPAT